jgi:uncharacterized membrane protein
VITLVSGDLSATMASLPGRDEAAAAEEAEPARADWAPVQAPRSGYLRVLDDAALADWAEECHAVLRLRVRPGDFVFPGAVIGEVAPAAAREDAQAALARGMTFGDSRSVEQDPEFAVRQLVEIGLRALSPSLHDPFTAVSVLDRLGAALCELAGRTLPDGRTRRGGGVRMRRPSIDYAGLVDAMFHMLRQAAVPEPAVMIRLLEVLAEVAAVERDPARRRVLRRHAELAREAAQGGTADPSVRDAVAERHARVLAALGAGEREAA